MSEELTLRRYGRADLKLWNDFVGTSKNATFLHDRNFMEYHSDRFEDHSIIIERGGQPVALLPANRAGDVLQSHGGLTYGGLLTQSSMTAVLMLDVVETLLGSLSDWGFCELHYKAIPHIFCTQPAEEDVYALMRHGAEFSRCDLSFAIPMARRLPFSSGRKYGAKKARKAGLHVRESEDFAAYWDILEQTLQDRHNAAPVHSLAEINRLHAQFPQNIRLFAVYGDERMIAGMVMFDCGPAVHAQYIAASAEGRDLGALDLLTQTLIETEFADRTWFSFGISTTDGGKVLNAGLSRQKEMFGARGVTFQHYRLKV